MPINRTAFNALVDDNGTGNTGTPWEKARIAGVILDPVDVELAKVEGRPSAFVRTDTPQATTSGAWANIYYQTAIERAPTSMWSSGVGHAVTVPEAGHYLVVACTCWPNNDLGSRSMQILKNLGATPVLCVATVWPVTGAYSPVHLSGILILAAGDQISVAAMQTTGAAMNVGGLGFPYTNYLQVTKMF